MNKLVTGDSAIGKNDLEFHADKKMAAFYYEDNLEILETQKGNHYVTEAYFGQDKYYYEVLKEPVIGQEGTVLGIVGVVHDITVQKNLEQSLRTMSITDSLTGLYNRAYFKERKQAILTTDHLPVSVLVGDSNGLKHVNDTYGHTSGDEILIETAGILKAAVGASGDIFRVGGDEFSILCPKTDALMCKEILNEIRRLEAENDRTVIPINTSFGYSTLVSLDESLSEKLNEAEKMMYREKHQYSVAYPEYYRHRETARTQIREKSGEMTERGNRPFARIIE
jgi:diguanylate cyclase (GGDEF)-like protein